MISNTNAYVIFDCTQPSYVKSGNQLVLLKNHVINDSIQRMKDPRYNNTDLYSCDKAEKIWRTNRAFFNADNFIAFDDLRPAEADNNFITLFDQKSIRDKLKPLVRDKLLLDKIVTLAYRSMHHPDVYKIDKSKKPLVLDIYEEQEKKLPKSLRSQREAELNALYDRITQKSSNFSIEKQPGLKEHLFGNGYSFVLFNCSSPSYLGHSHVQKVISKEMQIVIEKMGYCNRTDRIWRRRVENQAPFYLTYDIKGNNLGYSPSSELISILKIKGLCNEYMKFFRHPSYFVKAYQTFVPNECTSNHAEREEEKKIFKIIDDHFKTTTHRNRHKIANNNMKKFIF